MKFTVAFNGDESIFSNLPQSDLIDEVFGIHQSITPIIGNGRTFIFKKSENSLSNVVKNAREQGIGFNYLLNSSCIGPTFQNGGLPNLFDFLSQIENTGVQAVTIAEPFLIKFIKTNFPNLKVYASTILQIDSAEKAKYFEELGVDKIIICWNTNRNFKTLGSIRKAVSVNLEILANDWCLLGCPYRNCHYNASSHISSSGDETPFEIHHYYETLCFLHRLKDPSHLIRNPWIRPEDIGVYEDLGIETMKITERTASTEWNLNTLDAYLNRSFDGNLWNLITDSSDTEWIIGFNIGEIFEINNKALDGFLGFFLDGNCILDCTACNYCFKVAKKAVILKNQKLLQAAIRSAEDKLNELSKLSVVKEENIVL